jgi:hypothetical protein
MNFRKAPLLLVALGVGVLAQTPTVSLPQMSNVPKGLGNAPVPFGPKPSGCSAFELLVGNCD